MLKNYTFTPIFNWLLLKKKEFNNISIYWEYRVHKYIYFKHYSVYRWFFKNFEKNYFYNLVFFFNYIKYVNYKTINILKKKTENVLFKHFKFLNKTFLNYSKDTIFLSFFWWKLFFFYQKWNIISFYYIPYQYQLSWYFLSSIFILKKFIILFEEILIDFEKQIFLIYIFCKIKYSSKYSNISILFHVLHEIKFLLNNRGYAFLNLDFFFKKNNKLKKLLFSTELSFFSSEWFFFLKSSYHAFRSFLSINMYLTRSFFFNRTLVKSLDIWLLKNFNNIFFRTGYRYKNFTEEEDFYWSWWNIFITTSPNYSRTDLLEGSSSKTYFVIPTCFITKYNERKYCLSTQKLLYLKNFTFNKCYFFNTFMFSVTNHFIFFFNCNKYKIFNKWYSLNLLKNDKITIKKKINGSSLMAKP